MQSQKRSGSTRHWHRRDGRAKHLSLAESRPMLPAERFFHRSFDDCHGVLISQPGRRPLNLTRKPFPHMICERPGHITVKILWARAAKKSTKPEEPDIEGK